MKRLIVINNIILFLLALSIAASADGLVETKNGLKYEDKVKGSGTEAVFDKIVTVNLIIWADVNGAKGKKLFDSHDTGSGPISFKLGTDKFPDGLNFGINGMRVGGTRILYVPSDLNPKTGTGNFPGNADLIYEVELLKVN